MKPFQSFDAKCLIKNSFYGNLESFDHLRRNALPNQMLVGRHKLGILAYEQVLLHLLFFGVHNPIFPHAVGGIVNEFDPPIILCCGLREDFNHEVGSRKHHLVVGEGGSLFQRKERNIGFVVVARQADQGFFHKDFARIIQPDINSQHRG